MQIKNNKTFLYSILFTLFLSSAACNLAEVTANNDSANNHQETVINNSNLADLSAADSTEKKSPELTAQTITGTYHYNTYKPNKGGNDNTLEITDKGNGKLHVSLSGINIYMANGEETMHEVSGEGDAQLSGNIATPE